MFKNYLKIAWRNLNKDRVYSGINIGGLAIGICACLLILQYVVFEFSYEDFHDKKERIFRVQQDRYDDGKLATQWAAGAYAVGNDFKAAIPEIEDYVKVISTPDLIVDIDGDPLKIDKVYYTKTSFFSIFSYPLIKGDINTILDEPNTAAISESTALRVFGSTDVVGETLQISGGEDYKISGVYQDMPANTQLKPNFLASYPTLLQIRGDNLTETHWAWDGCLTYVLLQKNVHPKQVEAKFPPIVEEKVGELLKQFNSSVVYNLQPITDIHLYSNYMEEPGPNGDAKTVYLLLGIAFFIILIAWVNYINLATARSLGRAREVGVRKSVGSQRKQLVLQFFLESALFNGLAVIVALGIMFLVLPSFNRISGQPVSYALFTEAVFWLGLGSLFVVGVLLSGSYPAFVLSSFRPVEVLKGKMVSTKQGAMLRKSLVVLQFTASLFLLIGSLIVYQQIQFMRNQSLGIEIDQTLVIKPPIVADSTFANRKRALKEELLQYPTIKEVTVSSTVPGQDGGINAGGIRLVTQDPSEQKQYRFMRVDHDFADLFDLQMLAGRKFSKYFGSEEGSVIFNRMGINQLGFDQPEEAIGKRIEFWGDQYTIVGVTENFHQQSLRQAYEPLILCLVPDVYGFFSLRTGTDQIASTISTVQAEWDKFFPGNTFEYFFLDEHFNAQYKADHKFGQVFALFTLLAILVACLGLFGLASFTTLQRTREIGVRKVLGASVSGILKLLYREFALLLLLAFIISIPVAWYGATNWLEGYAFRIPMSWTFFLWPFIAMVAVALLTVSFQSIKAALQNPVTSLRTE
ncbi:MAG: ABC transporter permease [Bacteroidota bacterium]